MRAWYASDDSLVAGHWLVVVGQSVSGNRTVVSTVIVPERWSECSDGRHAMSLVLEIKDKAHALAAGSAITEASCLVPW